MTDTKAIKPEDNKGGTLTAQLTIAEVTTAYVSPVPSEAPGIITLEPGTVKEEAVYYTAKDAGAGTISGLTRDFSNLNGGVGQLHENGEDWEVLQSARYLTNIIDILLEGFIKEQNDSLKVDATNFTVETDVTSIYNVGRLVRFNSDNSFVATITASSYASGPGLTTITITGVTVPTITAVEYGLQPKTAAFLTSAFYTATVTLANKTLTAPQIGGDADLDDADGNITVAGVAPWRTITLTPGFLKPTTTSGCAASATEESTTNKIDHDVLAFDDATDEKAFANFQMPKSWDAGNVQFRYIWANAAGGSLEEVCFELAGRSFANSDAIDQANGTAIEVKDTWEAQNEIQRSAWSSDVELAGTPAAGEWVHLEIMRDVSEDDLTGDAKLIGLQLRYKQAQYSD